MTGVQREMKLVKVEVGRRGGRGRREAGTDASEVGGRGRSEGAGEVNQAKLSVGEVGGRGRGGKEGASGSSTLSTSFSVIDGRS
jgi:hypothetical protein